MDDALRGKIMKADTVAFDVFDTLVVRGFLDPKDVFLYLERAYGRPGFAKRRVTAEKRARRTIGPEPDLHGIYSLIPEDGDLEEKEIELEIASAFPAPGIGEAFGLALSAGKAVVISDMYLPPDVIAAILGKCGFAGYSDLYVSNALGLSKHKGDIYDRVRSEHGGRMLMIGDNDRDDIGNARAHGWDTFLWPSVRRDYIGTHGPERKASRRNPNVSRIAAADMMFSCGNPLTEDYWYSAASRIGGPMAYAFVRYIERQSADMDRLFFLSRDGHVPMLAYERIAGNPLPHDYVYGSRLLSVILGGENLEDVGSPEAVLDGIRGMTDRDIPRDPAGARAFLRDNRDEVLAMVAERRAPYAAYLSEKADGQGSIGLVDASTERFSSQRMAADCLPGREVKGIYYAVTGRTGLPYDAFADRSSQRISWTYINLSEFFFGSPEPPLADFDGGPVFESDPHPLEKERQAVQATLEKAQLDYCSFAADFFRGDMLPLEPGDIDAWTDAVLAHEKGNDPHRLSGTLWAVDTGHRRYRHLIFGWREYVFGAVMLLNRWRKRARSEHPPPELL